MVDIKGRRPSKNVEDRRGEKFDRQTTKSFKQDRNYENFVELVDKTKDEMRLARMDKSLNKPNPLVKSPRDTAYQKIIKDAADGKSGSPVSDKTSRQKAAKMVLRDGSKTLTKIAKRDSDDAGERMLNKASWSKTTKELKEMENKRRAFRSSKRKK